MGIGYFLMFWMQQSLWIWNFKKSRISSNLQDLIDDVFVVAQELSLLRSNIRRKVYDVLDGFFNSLRNMKEIKHITCCPLC